MFKLEQIEKNEKLLRPGSRVLDLGAAPGSWMQFCAKRVGPRGIVIGVDLKEMKRSLAENEIFIQADVNELDPHLIRKEHGPLNLALSDMAPNTIGHRASDHYRSIALAERAMWLADQLLRPGGAFLVKVFQGADFDQYRAALRERYDKVKIKKPESSRKNSREIYLLGLGWNGPPAESTQEREQEEGE